VKSSPRTPSLTPPPRLTARTSLPILRHTLHARQVDAPIVKSPDPTTFTLRTARHKIIFALFSLDAHGVSLLGGYVRLSTPSVRATFLAQATDKLKRLQTLSHPRPEQLAISTTTHRPSKPRTANHGPIAADVQNRDRADDNPVAMQEDGPSLSSSPALLASHTKATTKSDLRLDTHKYRQQPQLQHSLVPSEELVELLGLRAAFRAATPQTHQLLRQEYEPFQAA
jgi:hypothetical protein